ncbi:MAG: hypothetical protein OXF41_06765 [bacterium]|nr:hypothetical protein [bacterium]
MTPPASPAYEYLVARRVLIDALVALEPHIGAVIVIGAQAVYLRTEDRMPHYQPFTTDADLVIDPGLLAETPLLADAMLAAGFKNTREPGIWMRYVKHPGLGGDIAVPVDLIVPSQIAPRAGRRGARLPGGHGKRAARKTRGVEGALVDYDSLLIDALDARDIRRPVVRVAGPCALVVAKAHKLGERLATPTRLIAKDAGDIYRLFEATALAQMAAMTARLLADERSSATTEQALGYLVQLFGTPGSPGVRLAIQALADVADASTVTEMIVGYTRDLVRAASGDYT